MINTKSGLRSLTIMAFTYFLIACSSSSPGDTAEKFMTHLAHAEFTEAKQYASTSTGELVEMMGKMGAAMGGNGLLIGAEANLVTAGITSQAGTPISFGEFLKVGLPVTFLTLAIGFIWLIIRF